MPKQGRAEQGINKYVYYPSINYTHYTTTLNVITPNKYTHKYKYNHYNQKYYSSMFTQVEGCPRQ